MTDLPDPFREHRQKSGLLVCPFQGESIPMILGYKELRRAAKDWETFSNDAPFRVPIPSEETVRSVRQLPIETDPPDHTEYRAITEPFFKRPLLPDVIARIHELVGRMVERALERDQIEVLSEFSLPLQAKALTILLDVPESEADIWVEWGVRVFSVGDAKADGTYLERYLAQRLDTAAASPGADFFSVLTQAEFRGRKLTREEQMGFANLAFAGGRHTVIHTVSTIIDYIAGHPESLEFLRADAKRIVPAVEEFVRIASPLTHIGRVCSKGATVLGQQVPPGGRVALCWASANHDETIFADPDTVKLDRMPNPHIGFGSGHHSCMGAAHARLLLRTLLSTLCEKVARIEPLDVQRHIEKESTYTRITGFDRLVARFARRA